MSVTDALPVGRQAAFEAWLDGLRTAGGILSLESRAIARNHELESRVDEPTATDYADRVDHLRGCPRRPEHGEACMDGAKCATIDKLLCHGPPSDPVSDELISFMTCERLAGIMFSQGVDSETLQGEGCYDHPSDCNRIANEHYIFYGMRQHSRPEDKTLSLVWATDPGAVDASWDADEIRDRLGLDWAVTNELVALRYPRSAAGTCCVPTVVDVCGSARFQPADPGSTCGWTRDNRDNQPRLAEHVHCALAAGVGSKAEFYAPLEDGRPMRRVPPNDYLEAKLA